MRKFLAVIISFLVLSTPAYATFDNFRSGEMVTLGKNEFINKDYFTYGERVKIEGTINGDVYVAGGRIEIPGTVNGDVLSAARDLEITGHVNGNVRSVGQSVNILGQVKGNVTVLSARSEVGSEASVSGSLTAVGDRVQILGPIGRLVVGAGNTITLASTVGSDVNVAASHFNLEPGVKVTGDVTYLSRDPLNKSDQAIVFGTIVHNLPPAQLTTSPQQWFSNWLRQINAAIGIFSFFSSLLIGALLIRLFPKFTSETAGLAFQKPLKSLLVGFLSSVLLPISIILLLLTVIGIPLAMIVFFGYLLILYISKIFIGLAIGEKLLSGVHKKVNPYWALVAGLLVLSALTFIPIVGGLIHLSATILGVGAYLLTKKIYFTKLRSQL